ncbi:hypothetical protein Glove_294g113 [Diversispora epigaea]|uniref:Uncharacterized protein n=1 Tax=Diversispora epigaea TaxID=1348612 RepID=A0A397I0U7_9GLOM|nr:hypothetical protein Glove_294g113 [Diversispora epigaea]
MSSTNNHINGNFTLGLSVGVIIGVTGSYLYRQFFPDSETNNHHHHHHHNRHNRHQQSNHKNKNKNKNKNRSIPSPLYENNDDDSLSPDEIFVTEFTKFQSHDENDDNNDNDIMNDINDINNIINNEITDNYGDGSNGNNRRSVESLEQEILNLEQIKDRIIQRRCREKASFEVKMDSILKTIMMIESRIEELEQKISRERIRLNILGNGGDQYLSNLTSIAVIAK